MSSLPVQADLKVRIRPTNSHPDEQHKLPPIDDAHLALIASRIKVVRRPL